MTSTGKDDDAMASTVAAAAAAAVEASSTTETMAAATTAAMGIITMMDSSSSSGGNVEGEDAVVAPGMESTGRWTKQEHNQFLLGIEKYGKEWKKVAAFVGTRTVMQTRTHAQKFYEKLNQVALKATGSPLPSKSTSSKSIAPYSRTSTLVTNNSSSNIGAAAAAKKLPVPNPAFVHHGANSATLVIPPVPVVSFTELDILVPINDATASRPSNKIYMDIMKMNCFIFHSLPITEQLWFARNIVHYLSSVRHHRWIGCNYYGTAPQYQLLNEPVSVVQSDFRMDPLKVAAFGFHPLWLLGDHDIHQVHGGHPFIHRTVDGTWKPVTMSQVKDILNGEGPKNLLLLPSSIPTMEPSATATTTTLLPATTTTTATVTESKVEEEEDDEMEEEAPDDDNEEEVDVEESLTTVVSKKTKALPMAAAASSKRTATTTKAAAPPSEDKQRRPKRSKV